MRALWYVKATFTASCTQTATKRKRGGRALAHNPNGHVVLWKNNVMSTGSRIYNKNRVLSYRFQPAGPSYTLNHQKSEGYCCFWGSAITLDVNTFRRTITNRVRHISESIFQLIWFHTFKLVCLRMEMWGLAAIFHSLFFFFLNKIRWANSWSHRFLPCVMQHRVAK
jgi:hypothetical protein